MFECACRFEKHVFNIDFGEFPHNGLQTHTRQATFTIPFDPFCTDIAAEEIEAHCHGHTTSEWQSWGVFPNQFASNIMFIDVSVEIHPKSLRKEWPGQGH